MYKNLIASLLIGSSFVLAAPVFASGYGPATHYNQFDGAPASQRGQSAQTITSEQVQTRVNQSSFGGTPDSLTQSGERVQASPSAQPRPSH